jgi:hypothetical protein
LMERQQGIIFATGAGRTGLCRRDEAGSPFLVLISLSLALTLATLRGLVILGSC